jgi:RNA polymerase sigma-70 factor (ECF subfamily)
METTRANTRLDNTLFALTVLPHQPSLLGRARQLAGNDADAQDLVQETLERALRTFQRFRPGTAVAAWLMTIMRSVWIDAWRRRRRGLPMAAGWQPEPAAPPSEPPPLYEMADVILERLPGALAQLPPKLRGVLQLRLVDKMSYAAIAAQLGIPSRTVGTRLLRARQQLAAILESELPQLAEQGVPETLLEARPSRAKAFVARFHALR